MTHIRAESPVRTRRSGAREGRLAPESTTDRMSAMTWVGGRVTAIACAHSGRTTMGKVTPHSTWKTPRKSCTVPLTSLKRRTSAANSAPRPRNAGTEIAMTTSARTAVPAPIGTWNRVPSTMPITRNIQNACTRWAGALPKRSTSRDTGVRNCCSSDPRVCSSRRAEPGPQRTTLSHM